MISLCVLCDAKGIQSPAQRAGCLREGGFRAEQFPRTVRPQRGHGSGRLDWGEEEGPGDREFKVSGGSPARRRRGTTAGRAGAGMTKVISQVELRFFN